MRIAAILASFNRREKTLASLGKLCEARLPRGDTLSIYLTDDNSQDGTAQAIKYHFPDVQLLQGNGTLYWSGGMRLAFAEAMKKDYDFYLWVNDDTSLTDNALTRLLDAHEHLKMRGDEAIVVGSIYDPDTGSFSYGGRARGGWLHPFKSRPILPADFPQQCFTANGNCLLISRTIAASIGNISTSYVQSMGDYDYSLRAQRAGFSVWVAPGWLGTCKKNSLAGGWSDSTVPLHKRIQLIKHPKGLPPKEWGLFTRTHGGPLWFLYWLSPYLKTMLSGLHRVAREAF